MKSFLLIFSLAVVLASCSAAYKTGQTPDDVYFSPERPQQPEYVQVENNNDRYYRNNDRDREEYYDDRYLRMKTRNRQLWSTIDYGMYSYSPYAYRNFNNFYYYNSPWNPYSYWDYYYNPYAPNVIIMNPKTPVYSKPRTMNLDVFNNSQNAYNNPKSSGSNTRTYNETNSQRAPRNYGNDLRDVFGNGSSNNSSPTYSPGRNSSNSGSSNNSSSSGSSGGGNAPVRRF